MTEALDKLGKNSSGSEAIPTESSETMNRVKKQLNLLCRELKLDSDQYKPERTVNSISKYINGNSIGRILYSEISSFIVGLNESEKYNLGCEIIYEFAVLESAQASKCQNNKRIIE